MKKFILIIFLFLVCSGSAFADKKIEKALENCADDRFVNKTNINDFTPMLYLVQPKFQELEKELKKLKAEEEKDIKKFDEEFNKWELENPKPKMPNYNQHRSKEYTLEQYEKDLPIWNKKHSQAMDDIIAKLDNGKKDKINVLNKEINNFIRTQALKYLDALEDLNSKAKQVNGYLDHFTTCEKQYQETPSSFMLKWSN